MSGEALSSEERTKVLEYCRKCDSDGDGVINQVELSKALQEICPGSTQKDVDNLLQEVDINGDGYIDYKEFIRWMELPEMSKLSFSDHLRGAVLQRSRRQRKVSHPGLAHELLPPPTSSGIPDEFRSMFRSFTHPLLARFKVVSSFEAEPNLQVVVVGDSRARSSASEITLHSDDGMIFSINAAPWIILERCAADPPGATQIYDELENLAVAYEEILSRFHDAMASTFTKEGPTIKKLQLRPITFLTPSLKAQPLYAEKMWAAIAVALARLPVQTQNYIQLASVEVVHDDNTGTQLGNTLAAKVSEALKPLVIENNGRLPQQQKRHDWIRKDNSPAARLHRLQTFLMTQRSIVAEAYTLAPSREMSGTAPAAKLSGVQDMMRQTKIKIVSPGTILRLPSGHTETQVALPSEVGLSSDTVMDVARDLAQKGRRVAAVSAASAYRRGGGVSTGARHALEEAWCTMSTLLRSLQMLESHDTWRVEATGAYSDCASVSDFKQHIPTCGCVVSPNVEIFREPTSQGYGFLQKPVKLSAVISVAMFNRNPGVNDSPLDSPDDIGTYVSETQRKFEAVVVAAIELGVEDLVIPDAGCGVFQNDPLVVGGCLGSVLRKYNGHLLRVIIVENSRPFFDSCKRVLDGKDPRSECVDGAICKKLADKTHSVRCLHCRTPGYTDVDDVLRELVEYPEVEKKPACIYGITCRIKDPRHLARYSHPDAETMDPLARIASSESAPSSIGESVLDTEDKNQEEKKGDRPICRFGEKCYDRKPEHLAKYAHPWSEGGESAEATKRRKDAQESHAILDHAKSVEWKEVRVSLLKRPELVNMRPEPRQFALLHAACFQVNNDVIEMLIDTFGADPNLRTKDGHTSYNIYREQITATPAKTEPERQRDEMCAAWLRRLQSEKVSFREFQRTFAAKPTAEEEKISGAKMVVGSCMRVELNGTYAELNQTHDGHPVYRKQSSGGVKHYLFHYTTSPHGYRQAGWIINTELRDPGLAYIWATLHMPTPSLKPYGEYWRVHQQEGRFSSCFRNDVLMKVEMRTSDQRASDGCMRF